MKEPPKLTAAVFQQLWRIPRPFFFGDGKRRARGMLTLVLALSLGVAAVNVLMSYAGRDFMNALAARDVPLFYHHLWLYLGAFAMATPLAAIYKYVEET